MKKIHIFPFERVTPNVVAFFALVRTVLFPIASIPVISERESALIIRTRLYFDFRCWRSRSPQQVQDVVSLVFPFDQNACACVNCALINEVMLTEMISELTSRITRSLSLFYSVNL